MSAPDFKLGQYDDQVPWDVPIRDADGNVIDITGGSVAIHYQKDDGSAPGQDRIGLVLNGPQGLARYIFAAIDTGTPGEYLTNWVVTVGAMVYTYPTGRYMILKVTPRAPLLVTPRVPPPRRQMPSQWWPQAGVPARRGGFY